MVVNIRGSEFRWFDLKNNVEHARPTDGIYRLKSMPGLWVDSVAVLAGDAVAAMATLNEGLASTEHTEFVETLKANSANS